MALIDTLLKRSSQQSGSSYVLVSSSCAPLMMPLCMPNSNTFCKDRLLQEVKVNSHVLKNCKEYIYTKNMTAEGLF